MSLSTNNYTVTTTAVKVSPASGVTNSYTIIIQNNHASNIVYVGVSNAVTSSAYGVQLATGASIALDDLTPTDQVWVIASAASTPVSVFNILR
jgi:hypothetical protein